MHGQKNLKKHGQKNFQKKCVPHTFVNISASHRLISFIKLLFGSPRSPLEYFID